MVKDSCIVYWIHLPEHGDIFKTGYVGITTKPLEERFAEHKVLAKSGKLKYTISNAINKYGDNLICETILVGSIDYCKDVENKLRPLPNTAWNIAVGGETGVMNGRKHSQETKDKISLSNKGKTSDALSDSRKNNLCTIGPRSEKGSAAIREGKRKSGGWRLPWSNKEIWKSADMIYLAIEKYPGKGYCSIQKSVGIGKETGNILNVFNKIKNTGWIPMNDPEWVEWIQQINKGSKS